MYSPNLPLISLKEERRIRRAGMKRPKVERRLQLPVDARMQMKYAARE